MPDLRTFIREFIQSRIDTANDFGITLPQLLSEGPGDRSIEDSLLYISDLRRFHPELEKPSMGVVLNDSK